MSQEVLIYNFPQRQRGIELQLKENLVSAIYGFDITTDFRELLTNATSNLISSLLIHEKIYVPLIDFINIVDIFGLKNTMKLLENDILTFIDDNKFTPLLARGTQSFYVSFMAGEDDFLSQLEREHSGEFQSERELFSNVLTIIDRKRLLSDFRRFPDTIITELKYDLNNKYITKQHDIQSPDPSSISISDIYKVLRMLFLNKMLCQALEFRIKNLLIEGEAMSFLTGKFTPLTSNRYANSIEIFQRILKYKGIPDLGYLFIRKLISLEDVLRLRSGLYGRQFRNWYHSKDYDEDKVIQDLISISPSSDKNLFKKMLRFIIPNVFGFIEPISGLGLSAIDSFLLDKILKDWHPNLYLDDKLKKLIDSNMSKHQRTAT